VGLFRTLFGLLAIWHLASFRAYITQELPRSRFLLTFDGFHWLAMLPQPWLSLVYNLLFVFAGCVAAGLFFRASSIALCVGWTYFLLLCRGHYNNHSYLVVLLAFLLSVSSAARWQSLDGRLGRVRHYGEPIPFWQVFLLRAQVALVYLYAGVAKLTPDWLRGYPLRIWLEERADVPVLGTLLATDGAAYALSWGGAIFDLTIGFALLSRRWRSWALVPLVGFHLLNALIWNVGIFPWLMLATTVIFFEPDWPDRFLGRRAKSQPTARSISRIAPATVALVTIYLAWQIVFPLRHWAYPGSPEWHGQGAMFAWRMLAADQSEAVRMSVVVPGKGVVGYVKLEEYFTPLQLSRLHITPKAYVRFAHFLREEMERNAGITDAEIHVEIERRFNERPPQRLFDPALDLARAEYHEFRNADYILPFDPTPAPGTAVSWQNRSRSGVR
jgi:hypothetical protein